MTSCFDHRPCFICNWMFCYTSIMNCPLAFIPRCGTPVWKPVKLAVIETSWVRWFKSKIAPGYLLKKRYISCEEHTVLVTRILRMLSSVDHTWTPVSSTSTTHYGECSQSWSVGWCMPGSVSFTFCTFISMWWVSLRFDLSRKQLWTQLSLLQIQLFRPEKQLSYSYSNCRYPGNLKKKS